MNTNQMHHSFAIRLLTTVAIQLASLPLTAQVITTNVKPLTIGETRVIKSTVLNEERQINICLPRDLDSNSTYPVLYLLDGGMNEDLLHIAGLLQFYNLMFKMPPCIIAGISNTDRKRDFTFPTSIKKDKEDFPTTGSSSGFIRFIEEELQPYIKATYRVNDTRYLLGQSLGGLLATEILLKKPALFTHYFIVSPSLWWNNESLLKEAPDLLTTQPDINAYVYISVGNEGTVMEQDARKLAKTIVAAGKPGIKLDFIFMPDENHATILHNSIYKALGLLFPYKE